MTVGDMDMLAMVKMTAMDMDMDMVAMMKTRLTYNCAHLRSTKESLIFEYLDPRVTKKAI